MDGRSRLRPAWAVMVATLAVLLVFACSAGPGTASGRDLSGGKLEVVAVWSGVEQRDFELVLRAFTRQTGVSVTYTSAGHGVPDFLQARLAAGRLPDLAFLPEPGLLRRYAGEHLLVPLNGIVGAAVNENYNPIWRRLASFDGNLYGVWFKAANKSLIWYNVGVFERAGVVPPSGIDGLVSLAHRLAGSGTSAFAVGGADGWTLTDWFENLYLRLAGPARYDLLAAHRIPWTDPSVKATLALLAKVLDPRVIAGGPQRARSTGYEESVRQTFANRPAAAMVFEGDFVAGVISGETRAQLGVDADVFPFPAAGRSGPMVVAGGDAAVLMRQSPAGDALIRYLASPQAAAIWAARGGFVSPNISLDLSVYPDAISRSIAGGLLEAGSNLRFDLSDLQPASFGGTENRGMLKVLQDFLVRRDVNGAARQLEKAAREAYGP